MNYYEDVFKKRVLFRGNTKKEIIVSEAEVQFLENLATSANREDISIDGLDTQAIILTNKADQSKLSMQLHSQNSVEVGPGSLVVWDEEDWLVMSTDKFSVPAYVKSIMFKSNVRVKFYDDNGNLQNTAGIFLGSLDSILREAVYRQMGMAIQMDDRRAMLIVSKHILRNNRRLMLDGRVWRIVDYDSTSNKTLVYISLQEDHIDPSRDDVENGIADAKTAPVWSLTLPVASLSLIVDGTYTLNPTVMKDGVVSDAEWVATSDNGDIVMVEDGTVRALAEGTASVTIALLDNNSISIVIPVSVVAENPTPVEGYEIVGEDTIRWGDVKDYQLMHYEADGTKTAVSPTGFTLTDMDGQPTTLATVRRKSTYYVSVSANEKTQVGIVLLTITRDDNSATTEISIRSLW